MKETNGSIHQNHRQRIKKRFIEIGLAGLHDHEILELLLTYAIPRRDVNPIGHALIDRFGSLSGVFEASILELQEVDGVGENCAILLHLCLELFRKYDVDRKEQSMNGSFLTSSDLIGEYLRPYFTTLREELIMLVCVDNRGSVLYCKEHARGNIGSVHLNIRQIVSTALQCHAHAIILAHNHPHGTALPSEDDIYVTKRLQEALKLIEVKLLEHVIYADNDYVSMFESGML